MYSIEETMDMENALTDEQIEAIGERIAQFNAEWDEYESKDS
jgi:hypothetical protein